MARRRYVVARHFVEPQAYALPHHYALANYVVPADRRQPVLLMGSGCRVIMTLQTNEAGNASVRLHEPTIGGRVILKGYTVCRQPGLDRAQVNFFDRMRTDPADHVARVLAVAFPPPAGS